MAVAILCIALLARAGWGVYSLARSGDPGGLEFPDEQQYWATAAGLWRGEGLRDELGFRATRMPLYPALLAPFTAIPNGVVAAKVFHWFLGSAAAALAAALGTRLFGRRAGSVSGLWVALDPFLVFSSCLLLTETPFLCAVCGLWWLLAGLVRARRTDLKPWLTVGVVAAVTVYLRESSLGLVAAALAFVVLFRRCERASWVGAVTAGLVVVASLTPWGLRNRQVIGEWRWLTTRAGISLYDGVGPTATGASDLGDIKQMPAVRAMNEREWNQYFLEASFRALSEDPARILRLAAVKLARMWNPVPNVDTYQSTIVRVVSAGWTIPTFALAVIGAVMLPTGRGREGLRSMVLLLLPAAYLTLLHSLFIGSVRYRLGAMPMIEILAAFAVVTVATRFGAGPTALRDADDAVA